MNASEPAGEWKLFRDVCPEPGYYWTRYAGQPASYYEMVEVEADQCLRFMGYDGVDSPQATGRQYWTVPIPRPE